MQNLQTKELADLTPEEQTVIYNWYDTRYTGAPEDGSVTQDMFDSYLDFLERRSSQEPDASDALQAARVVNMNYMQLLDEICDVLIRHMRSEPSVSLRNTQVHRQLLSCQNQTMMEKQAVRGMLNYKANEFTSSVKYTTLINAHRDIYHALELVHKKLSQIIVLLEHWLQEQQFLTKPPED